jgi:ABC-2 type transport system permease protein
MFLVVFGFGFRQILAKSSLGIDFLQFVYPGIIAMNVMGIAFFSSVSTVWDREFGFLKEILVAPVSRTSIVVGKIAGAATVATLQALILLVLAPFIGVPLSGTIVFHLIIFMILLSFSIAGLGLLIASLMTTTESFSVVMQVLFFPMFFLSGAFFPLAQVPYWMSLLSKADPLTYGVDAFRQIMLSGEAGVEAVKNLALNSLTVDAFILLAFFVVFIIPATLNFNRGE